MKNIYFPDEEITFNDIYFVCYMIERTARNLKQKNNYVVQHMGQDGIARQLSIAETNHCLDPKQVEDEWIEEYRLQRGNNDVTNVDKEYNTNIPTEIQMGKVYARLVDSVTTDGDSVKAIQNVYASPICNVIDNYNSSAYYEPSYVQTRAYHNGFFE